MKKVTIIGYRGNMGRRYGSILDYLGINWEGIEFGDLDRYPSDDTDGFIIATPTNSHLVHLLRYSMYNKPILVEKPVVKNRKDLDAVMGMRVPVTMVNQYAFFPEVSEGSGETRVNYYNTGNDGILWDCINLIGLAKEDVYLSNSSPIWQIKVNGNNLSRGMVDLSYVQMLYKWTSKPTDNKQYIYDVHTRLLDHEESQSCDRYPSKKIFIEVAGKDRKAPCRESNGN